jgi:hypothetical protein
VKEAKVKKKKRERGFVRKPIFFKQQIQERELLAVQREKTAC